MLQLFRNLLKLFVPETTKLQPGETELDYVPMNEVIIKKKKPSNVVFHPKVKSITKKK
jgi:hypothetical protein